MYDGTAEEEQVLKPRKESPDIVSDGYHPLAPVNHPLDI